VIEITALAGIATVQDGGRPGHMHEGVPPGGALVPHLLARANAAARNGPEAAAIELTGSLRLVACAPVLVATDDGEARSLAPGEPWPLRASHRVGYVALRGGVDVPRVLGARATLLVARLGGLEGRPLRRGDRLACGDAPDVAPGVLPRRAGADASPVPLHPLDPLDPSVPLRVVLGPDLHRFAAHAPDLLLSSTWTVDARSDRVGVRLDGPALPRAAGDEDRGLSAPMVRGAIQVPAAGQPIVLGPDHPTLGGYPVLATLLRADAGALAARHPGATVHFVAVRP
jgi:allophanate hydrolase subunit 2